MHDLVVHLDGFIPLAIEFAAARAAVLSVQGLADDCSDRFARDGRHTPHGASAERTLRRDVRLEPGDAAGNSSGGLLRRLSRFFR